MMKIEYLKSKIIIDEHSSGERIDHFLFEYFSQNEEEFKKYNIVFSRTRIQKFIYDGNILINEILVKQSYIIKQGDVVELNIPVEYGEKLEIKAEKIYFEIIYNDKDLVVINKPAGLVVHPAQGHQEHTLINGILFLFPELRKNTNLDRMGIVHRLDKDTSGLLIITKNETAQQNIIMQFKQRKVKKEYNAIVYGEIRGNGEIDTRIGRNPLNRKRMSVLLTDGKEALTRYKVLRIFKNAALMQLMPFTGRTHQLRVHMHYIKHPIIGDTLYSKNKSRYHQLGLMLCAKKIKFKHPRTEADMEFEINLPDIFQIILHKGEV